MTTERDLIALFTARKKDRAQATSRRKKQREALPPSMGSVLDDFFGKDPQTARRLDESKAILAWATFIGEEAARTCVAQRVRGRQLVVKVPDPCWMQQLLLLKPEILAKYREKFPRLQLNDIFFTRR